MENFLEKNSEFYEFFKKNVSPIFIFQKAKLLDFNESAAKNLKKYGIYLDKGSVLYDIFSKEELKYIIRRKERESKAPLEIELINGRKIYVDYSVNIFKKSNEKIWVLTVNDYTQTMIMNKELKGKELKYKKILNTVYDGIVLIDEHMKIEFWSKGAEKILGYSKFETIGENAMYILTHQRINKDYDFYKAKYNSKNKDYFEIDKIQVRTKDNRRIIIDLLMTEYIENGQRHIVAIVRDITGEEKYKRELEESNSSLKSFISVLAHDLRTPIIQFLSMTELLLDNYADYDKDTIREYIEMLHKAAQNGFELIDKVLEWGRVMINKISFEPKIYKIDELIDKGIQIQKPYAAEKNIEIFYKHSGFEAYTDENIFFVILNNLLANAIKFSQLGSRIEIDVREGEKKLVVCVKDYGIGIEGDVLDKLFYESHKHVHLGTNNEKGTGVGLMLVKEFVRKNGGEIWAESEKGKGSSFYFSVPKA